jgi:TatD DNase family protein
MIDTHCHIDFKDFNKDRNEVLKRAKKNLSALINSGATLSGNRNALKLSKDYKGFIYPTLGFHPVNSSKAELSVLEEVISQINENIEFAVGIGETGMDYYHVKDLEGRKRQEKIFNIFAALAVEYELPLVIHARESEEKALEIVKQFNSIPEVIFHCYSGSLKTAQKILDESYYMSFSTMICFSKHHQELAENIPLNSILTETDSPYLSPFKGKRNEPSFVVEVVNKIAEIKGKKPSEVDKITEKNSKKVFGI